MNENEQHDPHWADEVAAYALGALEPPEAAELEAHLEGCERCRQELRWLAPAVGVLPEGIERIEPPRRVRERVMTEVRADARRERSSGRAPAAAGAHREGWLSRLRSGSFGWQPAAALAVVALALVAFAGYELGATGSGDDGVENTVVSGKAPGVVAEMVRDGDGGNLRLSNVRGIPDDRVLEAWVQRDGKVEAVPALFVPDHEGRASTTIDDMDGVEIVMVTHEPRGGSETPPSDPIVTMEIPKS